MSWIDWLFDGRPFLDRWHCVGPVTWLGWTLLVANGVTAADYLGMVVPLIRIYRAHRRAVGAAWLLAGSAAFIGLCGDHHFLYLLAFAWPAYRAMAVNDVLMATASTVMVVALWVLADELCLMRPASEVESERSAKDDALERERRARRETDELCVKLRNMLEEASLRLQVYESHYGRDRAYAEMRGMVSTMAGELRSAGLSQGAPADGGH